ncbi:slit homolog 1 protein [Plakobranchus ocellatus]|uniref:Slit homolog 1 protein n=1 Tax=Plakobranchus ocellatus TaxID=259542 RepID=A0AAV4E222_9GAST|nr:slit homolog 1 protein [Plakobranchus ocellatus]
MFVAECGVVFYQKTNSFIYCGQRRFSSGVNASLGAPSHCPQFCYCDGKFVTCSDFSFLDLTMLPESAETLVLTKGDIEEIPPAFLATAPNLKILELISVQVRILRGSAFLGLNKLQLLTITESSFDIVEPDSFSGITQVDKFEVTESKFGRIGKHAFGKISNVSELFFWSNTFGEITDEAFFGLSNVTTLQFVRNNITKIGSNLFANAKAIDTVTIFDNYIGEVSAGSFDTLAEISKRMVFKKNIFQCSCELSWMLDKPVLDEFMISNNCSFGTKNYLTKSSDTFRLLDVTKEVLCPTHDLEISSSDSKFIDSSQEIIIPSLDDKSGDLDFDAITKNWDVLGTTKSSWFLPFGEHFENVDVFADLELDGSFTDLTTDKKEMIPVDFIEVHDDGTLEGAILPDGSIVFDDRDMFKTEDTSVSDQDVVDDGALAGNVNITEIEAKEASEEGFGPDNGLSFDNDEVFDENEVSTDDSLELEKDNTIDGDVSKDDSFELVEDNTIDGDVSKDDSFELEEDNTIDGDVSKDGSFELQEADPTDKEVITDDDLKLQEDNTSDGDVLTDNRLDLQEGDILDGDVITHDSPHLQEDDTIDRDVISDGNLKLQEDETSDGYVTADGSLGLQEYETSDGYFVTNQSAWLDGLGKLDGDVIIDDSNEMVGGDIPVVDGFSDGNFLFLDYDQSDIPNKRTHDERQPQSETWTDVITSDDPVDTPDESSSDEYAYPQEGDKNREDMRSQYVQEGAIINQEYSPYVYDEYKENEGEKFEDDSFDMNSYIDVDPRYAKELMPEIEIPPFVEDNKWSSGENIDEEDYQLTSQVRVDAPLYIDGSGHEISDTNKPMITENEVYGTEENSPQPALKASHLWETITTKAIAKSSSSDGVDLGMEVLSGELITLATEEPMESQTGASKGLDINIERLGHGQIGRTERLNAPREENASSSSLPKYLLLFVCLLACMLGKH